MTGYNYATQLSDQSQKGADYWRQLYAEFNPPAATVRSPNVGAGYDQGAQMMADKAASDKAAMAENGQGMGNFDPTMNNNEFQNKLRLQQIQQQHGIDMGNTNKNAGLYQQQAVGDFGKMNRIGQGDAARTRSVEDANLGRFMTNDNINNAWAMYKYGSKDPFASAIGSFGGNLAGNALGKALYPSAPMPPSQDEMDIGRISKAYDNTFSD